MSARASPLQTPHPLERVGSPDAHGLTSLYLVMVKLRLAGLPVRPLAVGVAVSV